MARFLPFLISLVLSVYALFSCIQTRDEDVPHLPKLVWIILIVLVPFVGPITWLLMLRTQGRRPQRATVAGRPVRRPTARPVAPDDDPDFLASLERHRDPRFSNRPTDAGTGKGANGPKDVVQPEDTGKADEQRKADDPRKGKEPRKGKGSGDEAEVGPEDRVADSAADETKPDPDDGPRA
ncbi:MAG TPA: PLDc N-terminal domain-containing protein [Kribbella sp.]|nr:PLDc N-terminal domain-containing protein [Kribbella sp.]